ncbi:gluconokinase [Vreelandella boliviensis]|uniref:Gluconokinase n=1 Tax=Vreelandella boliviensis LC1 TaxID=1072583 RepID=A0A265DWZ0_9GAMM|nr:gluconokinase [Halomonas boliviensis]EHJ93229.1 Thermoresistant gluconokinase [Halomonas boliviensis LC1]OZT73833.1 gluconate kinase [Halomonas boliviensis LC1]
MHNVPKHYKIVVMGVSGCGKSLIGDQLASYFGIPFYDADDFHSQSNVNKMAEGIPLNDEDRIGWLSDLAQLLSQETALVLGCSALKRRYRERLRRDEPNVVFIYLEGDFATIRKRLAGREDHYFKGDDMLQSQFAQLEPPSEDEAVTISIDQPPEMVLQGCLDALISSNASPASC